MSDEKREAFEAWAKPHFDEPNLMYSKLNNCYVPGMYQAAWAGWQAATAPLDARIKELESDSLTWKTTAENYCAMHSELKVEITALTQALEKAEKDAEYWREVVENIATSAPADDMDGWPEYAQGFLSQHNEQKE